MSKRPSFRKQMRYRFDGYMSRGGGTLFVILIATITVFIIMMVGLRLLLSIFIPTGQDAYNSGPIGTAIIAFLQTFDPGFIAGDLPSSRWYIGSAVLAGVGGIILVALLTALLVAALEQRFIQLRKGQSQVVESGHTLILGWDDQRIVEIIKELSIAHEKSAVSTDRKHRHVIVLLAGQDKSYMDDHLRKYRKEVRGTRVVTRSGHQWSTVDLEIVSAAEAKSAIILSECSYAASDAKKLEADARVIKTLLALESCHPNTKDFHVVVELFRRKSRIASSRVGLGNVAALDVKTVLAGILLQTSRSVGLSVVYDELFSFRGAEFYLKGIDEVQAAQPGKVTFRDASARLTGAIAVGILRGPQQQEGERLAINPDFDCELFPEDKLIVVAGDDSEIGFGDPVTPVWPERPAKTDPEIKQCEKQLLIGWGPKTVRLLNEYAKYVDPKSTVHVMLRNHGKRDPDNLDPSDEIRRRRRDWPRVSVLDEDPTEPETWNTINPLDYDHIIILSDGDRGVSADVVDAKTITILLLLRHAVGERERVLAQTRSDTRRRTTIVTELVESDNQVIAPDIGLHDFVISSRVVSMLFAELMEDPGMLDIYMSLFQASGAEIYLKPISRYESVPARGTKQVLFGHLMAAANERGEICIGLKLREFEGDESQNYGVTLAPGREEQFDVAAGDALVVIAQHETNDMPVA